MNLRLSTWLAAALLGGAFIAGCGSSSSSTNSTSTSNSQATPSVPTTTSTSSPTATTPAGASSGINLQAAVAACRQAARRAPNLSASLKAKIEGICNKAASGNVAAARTAAREVCEEIINASPIPAGPTKEQALAECKTENSTTK